MGVGVGFFVGFGVAVGLGVAVGFDVGALVGCVSDTLSVAVTVGGLVACTVAVASLVLFRGRIMNMHTATIRQVKRIFQTGFSRSAFQMAMMPMIGVKKIQSSTLPNVTFFFGSSGGIVQRSPCMSMPAGVPQFEQKLPVNSVPHLPHRWTKVLPPQAVQKAFPSLFSVPQFLQIFMLFPPFLSVDCDTAALLCVHQQGQDKVLGNSIEPIEPQVFISVFFHDGIHQFPKLENGCLTVHADAYFPTCACKRSAGSVFVHAETDFIRLIVHHNGVTVAVLKREILDFVFPKILIVRLHAEFVIDAGGKGIADPEGLCAFTDQ